MTWGAGTVYLKWARIDADPMGVATWQLAIAFVVVGSFMLVFEGRLDLRAAHADGLFALLFVGVISGGIAYGLWFEIVRRLPAVTASLGVLSAPVVGVVASVLILGERPSAADIIGFALILAASACVLLSRSSTAETASQGT